MHGHSDEAVKVPISVVIPTYKRVNALEKTLAVLNKCRPSPAELLVHIDNGDTATLQYLREHHPYVRTFISYVRLGPGGGRNVLVENAINELVVSFDDDSYPDRSDFFGRVLECSVRYPDAAVLAANIYHPGESLPDLRGDPLICSDFVGCGAVYRRGDFLKCRGYVPVPVAYGIEEVDLALRLHMLDKKIVFFPELRVFHDTNLNRHADPVVTAASIRNIALLGYLRYPFLLWGYAVLQCLNRGLWCLRRLRFAGILNGFISVPSHIWKYRGYRSPVSMAALRSFLRLRRASM